MIEKKIKEAIKKGKVILGFRESLKAIKNGKAKEIVIAENIPENLREVIEYNAKIGKIKIEVFNGSSVELGRLCGRPFPVSTLVIKR